MLLIQWEHTNDERNNDDKFKNHIGMTRLLVTLTWESGGNFNIAAACHFNFGSLTLSSPLFANVICEIINQCHRSKFAN